MLLSPDYLAAQLNSLLPEPQSSLINGMVLGRELTSGKEFTKQLKDTGIIHLVVLSGSNISLVTAIICSSTHWLSKKSQLLLSVLLTGIFVIFVGAEAPILRAYIMSVLTSVSIILGRKREILYILFLSGLLSLLVFPSWATSISFQLSYAATLGIILFGSGKGIRKSSNNITSYVSDSLRVTCAAQLFTTPIIAFYFRQVSIVSPLTNTLIGWTVLPIMVGGILSYISILLLPFAAPLFYYPIFGLATYIVYIVRILSMIPYAAWYF